MKTQTFSFAGGRWSEEPDGKLDSERTLVVLFGASSLLDQPAPVRRVIDACTHSSIVGCSTSRARARRRCQHAVTPPPALLLLSIAISCVGRRLVLGERAEEETEAVLEVLPPDTRQIGFYSYGEISPYASAHCDLNNQTMTLTIIGEA